jgi:hypothetical protein
VAHLALVGEPGEAAGARQDPEQRHFGQCDRRRAVVDQPDLVARERELVAAARASAVHRRQELEPAVHARILEAVAGLVGELAEVDLPRVRGKPEHEDVGAGAEDALARAGDDHRADFRALESDALERVVELDVDAEVVGIELELVSLADACVLGDVHRKPRDGSLERELPVPVAGRVRAVVDLHVLHESLRACSARRAPLSGRAPGGRRV